MNYIKNINKYLFYLVFALVSTAMGYAQCTVNAGGGGTTCGAEFTVRDAAVEGGATNLTWTLESKPSGATDPVIIGVNSLNPTITGLNKPGYYKFRLSKKCDDGGTVHSLMTVTSSGDISTFSAGTDITTIPATTGVANLNGVIPEGFTGVWKAENIYELRFGRSTDKNAVFGNKNSSNTTFSLVKKANHDIDPAYKLTLKITSIYNPNCTLEKTIIVRFIPNPEVIFSTLEFSQCGDKGVQNKYIHLADNSPILVSSTEETSGHPDFGTVITLNPISVPTGGSITYVSLDEDRFNFTINDVIGVYRFTFTITNSAGTHTTPIITYEKKGNSPKKATFLDPAHPEQRESYSYDGSGGEVKCDFVGKNTPITIYFAFDESDDYAQIVSDFYVGDAPAGWTPTFQLTGQGQRKRAVTVNAPVGGWKAGTYSVLFQHVGAGGCTARNDYFIHISDGQRTDLAIENIVVCYPGSGTVEAVVPLPEVYQEKVDPSYLLNYGGRYDITVLSKPTKADWPAVQSSTIKDTSTIIRNLNKPGEYVFKAKVKGRIPMVEWLLEQEYACSGASMETTFKVIVSEQIGANAGSDQTGVFCRERTVLVGNDIGDTATGQWTLESAPAGTTPSFSDDSSPRVVVAGLDKTGSYKFKWTVKTGDCIASSIVEVITDQDNCKAPKIITNPMLPNKTKRR